MDSSESSWSLYPAHPVHITPDNRLVLQSGLLHITTVSDLQTVAPSRKNDAIHIDRIASKPHYDSVTSCPYTISRDTTNES